MRMGIEKVLKEKIGETIKDIKQVFEETQSETTAEGVDNHLNILMPAIKNFGGSVEVVSVEGGDCTVKYVGPDSIGSGIKATIKEKFPDIVDFHQMPISFCKVAQWDHDHQKRTHSRMYLLEECDG